MHWCWEHPQSTVAHKTAWMKVVQQIRDIMKVHTWQGMFDGPTMKPTFLFSWSQFHAKMKRTMPRDEATSGRWDSTEGVTHLPPSPSGRLRVSGNPQLKRSQRYPEQFCGRSTTPSRTAPTTIMLSWICKCRTIRMDWWIGMVGCGSARSGLTCLV